jgi:hypothetical protein
MIKVADGVDYSSSVSRPSTSQLQTKGFKFVVRYLSGYASKDISKTEYQTLTAAGVKVVLVYEKQAQRPESGKTAGIADAKAVQGLLATYGLPADAFVYYAVDYDTTVGPNITGYFQGVNSVRGVDKTGVYGSYAVVTGCLKGNLVSKAWQTYAWSGGKWSTDSRTVLRQVKNGVKYSGWPIDVDIDEAWAAEYGFVGGTTAPAPKPHTTPVAVVVSGKDAFIKAMKAYLGQTEHPPGSNYVPVITGWYDKKFHIGTVKFSWCDATVTKAAWDSGQQKAVVFGTGFAFVPAHFAMAKAMGLTIHTGGIPPKGAIVGYRWDGAKGTTSCDHIGVCEASDGKTFYSIEGNIGDECRREHRDSKFVSVWFMPVYINTEGAGVMQVVLDMGMKNPHNVSAGTLDTPARSSMPYEIEYADSDSIHADVAKDGTRYPSIYVKGDMAGYLLSVELAFADVAPDDLYCALALYKRDSNDWVRDVRKTQIPPGVKRWIVPLQVRLSDANKCRVDLLNASGTALTVVESYLIMYK